jgi:hypothetical protein
MAASTSASPSQKPLKAVYEYGQRCWTEGWRRAWTVRAAPARPMERAAATAREQIHLWLKARVERM